MLTFKTSTRFAILTFVSFFLPRISAQTFLAVDWSKRTYGPDGPWNAVSVQVGGMRNSTPIKLQQVPIDLYPGSTWSTFVPSNVSYLDRGTEPSPEWNVSVGWQPTFTYNNTKTNLRAYVVPQAITIGGQTIYQADLVSVEPDDYDEGDDDSVTYPNGVSALPQVGLLALTAGPNEKDMIQIFDKSATNTSVGAASVWIPAGYLYNQSIIPSYSYGLHIGSAALGYSGSLLLGGYDKARVIGPYTTYGSQTPTLLDIGIGVETGGSPFAFQNKTGLLVVDNDNKINVEIVPHSPSLYLPPKTCDGLTKVLPIYFDQTTKYYLWNTSDPAYKQIVTSPAYLSFTFPPAPGATNNVTIKIPFGLLNLTLSSPIVSTPLQYFPCQATTPSTDNGMTYALGRAFLQGAFVGWNVNANIGWLAQAPGPGDSNIGLGSECKIIANDATILEVYDGTQTNYFAQSWAKHWTPLPPTSTTPSSASSTQTSQSKTISTGAIAGIAVGAIIAIIALITGIVLCMRRKRKHKAIKEIPLDDRSDSPKTDDIMIDSPSRLLTPPPPFTHGPSELHQGQFYQVSEMPSNREIQELHSEARAPPVRPGRVEQRDVHELGLPPTPIA
ncbi:unnamed protein product [Aureobasidium uvarum]|uniref:Peptidase A1 domain-containing protein n=1 Tax=Aureobasidium uvarum TaxID=2773716 RepID=A0A9N8PQG4_9PEZI|nr:unnamed protein product [Aureobasidium uvarum]